MGVQGDYNRLQRIYGESTENGGIHVSLEYIGSTFQQNPRQFKRMRKNITLRREYTNNTGRLHGEYTEYIGTTFGVQNT